MPSTGSAVRSAMPPASAPARAPGSSPAASAGRPAVDAVLRSLPSHGWTAGWAGRRDRALLVLRDRAGLSFADLAALTVDDIEVDEGVATVRAGTGDPVTLRMTQDCLLCGPCALVRWLHALDLSTVHNDGRVVASVIGRAAPLTAHSPHVCEGRTVPSPDTVGLRVFPASDPWTSVLPAPARPVHDIRFRPTAPTRRHADHARIESNPAPIDACAALESRSRALMGGLA